MVVADCHVHTTNSDGSLPIAALPAAAERAGLAVVAVTDHDRYHPALEAPVVERDGITVVHGLELRVGTDDGNLDLLAFGVERTDALRAELERLQADRKARGARIVERVKAHLGRSIPVEPRPGLGRPHVARAIAEVTDHDVEWAFRELIGDDGPCYVPRDVPTFDRGRDLLADAAPVVGLAHPLRYANPAAALEYCETLDAVERAYPYDGAGPPTEADLAPVDRAIDRYDLLEIGGSDAHDDELGLAGLDRAGTDRFLAALE